LTTGAIIIESFNRSFGMYDDLIAAINETALAVDLRPLRSNTLGSQLWCVVGARESYSQAIAAGAWAGFSCSLNSTTHQAGVARALQLSAQSVADVLKNIDDYTSVQNRLVIDLLEHEAAHHGQLIRYMYGLKLPIPASWKSKYALKDHAS